ncbi:recombinase family protein, partial [Parafrankia sp. BMG5.11]|uniref:recombinase family protein n=1 Tax=Parafrankia sp. BMG5.11 TaxID=222540 RepID=UPI00104026C6
HRKCGRAKIVTGSDEQARTVVGLVFDLFDRLGTLNAVLRWLVDHEVQLPVRSHSGVDKGELTWRRPNRETLQVMLHNPIYAGYYAYGRRRVDARRRQAGRPSTGRVVRAMDDWHVLLPDRMPAYISTERYAANLARLEANRQIAASPGAPRSGSALLAGLLRCGRCGHRMTVSYHTPASRFPSHNYHCAYLPATYGTGRPCQHLAGPALDRYVIGQLLDAVAPAALEVSLAAAAHAEADRAELDALWHQRLERARYTAQRARRQYQLAEPENRLVTRQLETDWETALADLDRLTADYQRFVEARPQALAPDERQAITALARDLPALWNAPTTSQTDRKQLLRTLIDQVTVAVVGTSELVDVTITWAGGHQTHGRTTRPVARLDQLSYYPHLVERITELADAGHSSRQIADQLNTEGLRPPKRTAWFGPAQILTLTRRLGIGVHHPHDTRTALANPGPGRWSVADLAVALHMPTATLYNWIYRGWITAQRHPDGRSWIILADDAEIRRLRERRDRPPGYYTRARWTQPRPAQPDPSTNGTQT